MDRQPLTRATSGPRRTAQCPTEPTTRHHRLAAGVLAVAVLGSAVLAGCSSGKSARAEASAAAGEVQKAASAAASAASALASAAGGVGGLLGSAQAEASAAVSAASSAVAGIKGGLDAKGDVSVGAVSTGSDGKPQAQLTVTNHGQESYRYVVQVNFTDGSGTLLDATAVTVQDVAAGQSAQATAQANRELSGTVKAEVANAVRF
ncbi:FxLYD domain-containing protein [Kitasatospora sp. NPDC098652]|uniref:FxLYD domain-containing protein n=1 Tax=Kitasatospora sp. NPDC098652 TaxID=3364095 RepID=UPI0038144686